MSDPADGRPRVILFLQGPISAIWQELGDAFRAAGHRVVRVNLSAGDWLYWRRPGAINYRGSLAGWPDFLRRLIRREGITDILYYADRFPYHRVAADVAREEGAITLAVEYGYIRPDWITLEREGMSAFSHVPRDPERIRAIAAAVPPPDLTLRYSYPFPTEATNEVVYNLTASFFWPFYPRFDADKFHYPLLEYLAWLPKLALSRWAARRAAETVARATNSSSPFFVFPLQLPADYQIRDNAPFPLDVAIERVIASFARHAPEGTRLIVKLHPLDNHLTRLDRVAAAAAATHGVSDRIDVIDGGNLRLLLARSAGVVVVNSTTGLQAIQAGRPVKVLGSAIYDVPGLVFPGPLDAFWQGAPAPDTSLAADLVRALAATVQVKGSFYSAAGRAAAISEIVKRVIARTVNEPMAYEDPPPRLADHRRAQQQTQNA